MVQGTIFDTQDDDESGAVSDDMVTSVIDRMRKNIRVVKALRGLSDGELATRGGFTSRQVLNHRLTGRTVPDVVDLVRIASALDIDPHVLLLTTADVIRAVAEAEAEARQMRE